MNTATRINRDPAARGVATGTALIEGSRTSRLESRGQSSGVGYLFGQPLPRCEKTRCEAIVPLFRLVTASSVNIMAYTTVRQTQVAARDPIE
jgi:hypothetical protein